jgi:hypothetical protein
MSSSSKRPKTKTNRATSSRKSNAGDDNGALAIRSIEEADSSTAITVRQQRDLAELDSNCFQYDQMLAASTNPNTQLPSDRPSNTTSMASRGNPTDAPGASQPKTTGAGTSTGTTQEQTSAPERHQALRDLFRTRSHQTHKQVPESQRHDNNTTEQQRSTSSSAPTSDPSTTSSSATASPKETYYDLLEEIDLRSPRDDPDYDIISPHEAQHSSRNAQPDHASKYPNKNKTPKPKTQRSSSSPSSSSSPHQGFESDEDSDSGEDESDGELTSWRSYDFVWESEAKHSARNAQADRASKYPELMRERAKDGKDRGGDEGRGKGKEKGWMGWFS